MANRVLIKKQLILNAVGVMLAVQLFLLSAHLYLHIHDHHDYTQQQPFKDNRTTNDCPACHALNSAFSEATIMLSAIKIHLPVFNPIWHFSYSGISFENTDLIRGPPVHVHV
jgi:hypothetical protein